MSTKLPVDPPRSPSPSPPGAWPPTPHFEHRRSETCPSLPSPIFTTQERHSHLSPSFSAPLPERKGLAGLDHVVEFHRRLSHELASPESNSYKLFPSFTGNSRDADLTRQATDSSLNSSYTTGTTPEDLVPRKFPPKEIPGYDQSPQTPSGLFDPSQSLSLAHISRVPFSNINDLHGFSDSTLPSMPSPRFQPALTITTAVPSQASFNDSASNSSSPGSPIVFRSPTSSSRPPQLHDFDQSFFSRSSTSWAPSGDGDSASLSQRSLSPSPNSLVSSRYRIRAASRRDVVTPQLRNDGNSVFDIPVMIEGTPRTLDEFDLSVNAVPFTSFNRPLPSSDNSIRVSEIGSPTSPALAEEVPWTLLLSGAPPSPTPSLSLHSRAPTRLSSVLSSSSSLAAQLTAPTPSPLHFSEYPISGSAQDEGVSSAAEYAAAVVSSSWSPDGPCIEPMTPIISERRSTEIDEAPIFADSPAEPSTSTTQGPQLTRIIPGANFRASILVGFKKLGAGARQLLSSRKSKRSQKPSASIQTGLMAELSVNRVLDVAVQQEVTIKSNGQTISTPIPSTDGLNVRAHRARPSLTPQTYAAAAPSNLQNTVDFDQTPAPSRVLNRRRDSSFSPGVRFFDNHPTSPATAHQIRELSRPKTVSQITGKSKSHRRFSFASLTSLIATSPFPPHPSTSIPSSSHRPRSAAWAAHPRSRYYSSVHLEPEDFNHPSFVESSIGEVPVFDANSLERSAAHPAVVLSRFRPLSTPPGLCPEPPPEPSKRTTSPSAYFSRSTTDDFLSSIEEHSREDLSRLQARRMSLPSVPSFADGLKDGGS